MSNFSVDVSKSIAAVEKEITALRLEAGFISGLKTSSLADNYKKIIEDMINTQRTTKFNTFMSTYRKIYKLYGALEVLKNIDEFLEV